MRNLNMAICLGWLLVGAGIAVAMGWQLRIPVLVQLIPGYTPMVFNTALGFICCGGALVSIAGKKTYPLLAATFSVAVIALALAHIPETFFRHSMGIDQPELHRWLPTTNSFPGRMALSTNISFLLAGFALLWAPSARTRWQQRLVRWLSFLLIGIGTAALVGYLLQISLLYSWYAFTYMAVHTAIGFVTIGIGLWLYWRRTDWHRRQRIDIGIVSSVTWGFILVAAVATLPGYVMQQRNLYAVSGKNLQAILQSKEQLLANTLELRTTRAAIVANRPALRDALQRLLLNPADINARKTAQAEVESFEAFGFSSLRLTLPSGEVIAQAGNTVTASKLNVPVATGYDSELLWANGLILKHRQVLRDRYSVLGILDVEQNLPRITAMIMDLASLGVSADLRLCQASSMTMSCFPSLHSTEPLITQDPYSNLFVDPQNVTANARIITNHNNAVLVVHTPVDKFGVLMVLKIDSNEMFEPLAQQFAVSLIVLLVLIVAGTLLIRSRVSPLVTKLMNAEQRARQQSVALAESEARFRSTIEHASIGMAIVALDGNWLDVNAALCSIVGYSKEELQQLTFQDITHPDDINTDLHFVQELISGARDSYQMEKRYINKSGREIFVLLSASMMRDTDQRPLYFISQIVDITARKLAESILRDTLAFQTAILESANFSIISTTPEGVIRTFNRAAQRMLGYTEAEVVNIHTPALIHDKAEVVARAAELSANLGRTIEPGFEVFVLKARDLGVAEEREWTYICKDGSSFPVLLSVTAVIDANGQLSGFLGIANDISERKKNEQLIRTALAEKEMLLKEVYHRVKNNLQVITSLFNLQIHSLPQGDARTALREGADRVRTMALVHEKLYQSPNLSSISLPDYVTTLCKQLESVNAINQRGVQLQCDIAAIDVGMDTAIPLSLLLNELLSNSMKHGFPDGRRGTINVSIFRHDESFAELMVADDGVGFPDEFDPSKAVSLGFKLAYALSRQLDGTMSFDNAGGARVKVIFKLLEAVK